MKRRISRNPSRKKKVLRSRTSRRSNGRGRSLLNRRSVRVRMKRRSAGIRRKGKRRTPPIRLRRSAAAVVTCRNEQRMLPAVLRQLERLPLQEIIVVINGSTDLSLERALKFRKTTIVWLREALGHDVARAVGARISTADIVLFMDGDLPIRASRLVPFLRAVQRGADIALNNLSPFTGDFSKQDHVTRLKTFLNRMLGRPDLAMNSMTAVPHAVSRRLIDTVGIETLAVPPKAQALALLRGLRVTAPASVNVTRRNRRRPHNIGMLNPVAELIIGDHLEAISLVMQERGIRGAFPDVTRRRDIARGDGYADEHHYSVI